MVQPHRAQAVSPALRKVGDLKEGIDPARRRSPDLGWQTEAYDMAREVGEAGYVLHLTANTASMCNLAPREIGANGSDLEETTDERVLRVMRCLVGPRGGQKEIKRKLVLHAATAGEWYLTATPMAAGRQNYGILWEALSVRELRWDAAGRVLRSKNDGPWTEMGADCYVARGWVSDAEFSDRADSQMRRALPTCKEVAAYSQVVEATSRSRVAAGLLFVPEELSFAGEDATDEEEMDALTEELLRHLSAPITDRTSAAAYVPLVIRGKAEYGEKIKLIDLGRDLDVSAIDTRDRALVRMAKILDVPPEIIDGKGGLNHWTGFNIDADFITKHVVPLGELLADFLTAAFLRPMLEEFEAMTAEEAARFTIEFDPSPVTARADTAAASRALHGGIVLSDEVLVRANGFDPDDMPDDDEKFQRQAWSLISSNPGVFAAALLPLIPGFEQVDVSKLGSSAPSGGPGAGAAPGRRSGFPPGPGEPSPGPETPDAESGADEPRPSADTPSLVLSLLAAADSAVERALERAGSRVATAADRSGAAMRARVKHLDRVAVFEVLGPADLAALKLSPVDLFGDAWDRFDTRARAWLRGWAVATLGMSEVVADDLAQLATRDLCDRLNDWLLTNLHKGITSRGGFSVPAAIVEDVIRAHAGVL